MVAVGIITLILTIYVFIYYSYIHRHTEEHDVSFFLSVCIISLVMNLCTNAGGTYGLAWLYLGIDVLFIGLGFLVSTPLTLAFYKSIVPFWKNVFSNIGRFGYQVLSLLAFPAGIALYFVWYRDKTELALDCGRMALWGVGLWVLLLWTILGIAL